MIKIKETAASGYKSVVSIFRCSLEKMVSEHGFQVKVSRCTTAMGKKVESESLGLAG